MLGRRCLGGMGDGVRWGGHLGSLRMGLDEGSWDAFGDVGVWILRSADCGLLLVFFALHRERGFRAKLLGPC